MLKMFVACRAIFDRISIIRAYYFKKINNITQKISVHFAHIY